jgi:hypothetical protein
MFLLSSLASRYHQGIPDEPNNLRPATADEITAALSFSDAPQPGRSRGMVRLSRKLARGGPLRIS